MGPVSAVFGSYRRHPRLRAPPYCRALLVQCGGDPASAPRTGCLAAGLCRRPQREPRLGAILGASRPEAGRVCDAPDPHCGNAPGPSAGVGTQGTSSRLNGCAGTAEGMPRMGIACLPATPCHSPRRNLREGSHRFCLVAAPRSLGMRLAPDHLQPVREAGCPIPHLTDRLLPETLRARHGHRHRRLRAQWPYLPLHIFTGY